VYWDHKVTALEDVLFMGRTIKAFKVQAYGYADFAGGRTALTATSWINPSTMLRVKGERLFRSHTGSIVEYEKSEIVDYKPVPR